MNEQSTISIPLTRGASCIISAEDADLLAYKWHLDSAGYARRNVQIAKRAYAIHVHRVILERVIGRPLQRGEQTDHINGNPLDNRRDNLRVASPAQNSQNRKVPTVNRSGYKGVCYQDGKWQAILKANGRSYYLGRFATPEAAHEAYERAAEVHHSAFRRANPDLLPAEASVPA